ncbi:MAG: mechanosensitive ion channel [Peptostreptococcaceae bacterium]
MENTEVLTEEVSEFIRSIENLDFTQLNYNSIFERLFEWSTSMIFKFFIGFIIISIGFKLIKKFVNHIVHFLEKKDVDITLIKFLDSLSTAGLKISIVMPVLAYWGVELSGIAALVASAGVAVGLALQGSLSNFAGGFIILLIRPFKVGDFIETTEYSGNVEQIGLFYTSLLTIDNKTILIPNGILSNGSLINYSAKPNRRVDLIFSVGYENSIPLVRKVLRKVIDKNELALSDPEPFIGIDAHNASSVDFVVKVWCETDNFLELKHMLLEEVKIAFDEENISIPYPQMDLHLKQ